MTRPPRFVAAVVVAVVAGLIIAGCAAWVVRGINHAEERRDCARAVATRDDARAMWLYLIDTATSDPERVETFAKKLDELLPALKCEDGNWVPIHEEPAA